MSDSAEAVSPEGNRTEMTGLSKSASAEITPVEIAHKPQAIAGYSSHDTGGDTGVDRTTKSNFIPQRVGEQTRN